jgi:hypothetical protein
VSDGEPAFPFLTVLQMEATPSLQGSDYVFSIAFTAPVTEAHRKDISAFLHDHPSFSKLQRSSIKSPCFADIHHKVIAFEVRDLAFSGLRGGSTHGLKNLDVRLRSDLPKHVPGLPSFAVAVSQPRVIAGDPEYHLAVDSNNQWIALFPRPYCRTNGVVFSCSSIFKQYSRLVRRSSQEGISFGFHFSTRVVIP